MNNRQNELLQRALLDINKYQNSPAHRALMEHHDRMQRNPAYRQLWKNRKEGSVIRHTGL